MLFAAGNDTRCEGVMLELVGSLLLERHSKLLFVLVVVRHFLLQLCIPHVCLTLDCQMGR